VRNNAAAAGIIQAGPDNETVEADDFVVADGPVHDALATTAALMPDSGDEEDGERGALMRKIMEKKVADTWLGEYLVLSSLCTGKATRHRWRTRYQ
jgi:hypothetical protein